MRGSFRTKIVGSDARANAENGGVCEPNRVRGRLIVEITGVVHVVVFISEISDYCYVGEGRRMYGGVKRRTTGGPE